MAKIEDKDKLIRELADLRYKKGWSRTALIQYLKDAHKLNQSRAYDYVREMMEKTAEAYHKTNTEALSDSIEFMEEMREKAVKANNDKMALEWSKEIHRVGQLYIQKMELTSNQPIVININTDKKNEI